MLAACLRSLFVDVEGEGAQVFCVASADGVDHLLEGDVFVVADGVLGCGGEDRLGEAVGLAQACGELDAADGSGLLVILPAGAGEIAADDALDGEHLGAFDDHAAAFELAA